MKPEFQTQLNKLLKLRDGWLDGEGRAPNKQRVKRLFRMLDTFYPSWLPTPYVYPTPEGNVQIEWSIGKVEWSMEVDLGTYRGRLYGLWMDSGHDVEADYNLALHADRERLFSTLLLVAGPKLWHSAMAR